MNCPFCKEEISDGAIKCKHCMSVLSAGSSMAQLGTVSQQTQGSPFQRETSHQDYDAPNSEKDEKAHQADPREDSRSGRGYFEDLVGSWFKKDEFGRTVFYRW